MRDRYWLFDLQGTAKLDRLLEVFTYAHRRYGCTHFVIDRWMMTDTPEDGPGSMTAQKDAMRKLCALARGLNVHLHLGAHPRKARDESQAPHWMGVVGSSKTTDGAESPQRSAQHRSSTCRCCSGVRANAPCISKAWRTCWSRTALPSARIGAWTTCRCSSVQMTTAGTPRARSDMPCRPGRKAAGLPAEAATNEILRTETKGIPRT